jgi:hypothetical protein
MAKLPEPINGTERYLAAVLDVLCDIRAAVVGGAGGNPDQVAEPDTGLVELTEPDPPTPTKRTRTRVRG